MASALLVGHQPKPVWVELEKEGVSMVANLSGITVALFATCINDVMFPGTPKAVVQVLSLIHI